MLVASFSICLLIYSVSLYYSDNRITKFSDYVRLNPGSFPKNIKKIAIFADDSVLGKYYGKTIRHAKNEIADMSIDVFPGEDGITCAKYAKYDTIILCGRMVRLLESGSFNTGGIIAVNPVGLPKYGLAGLSLIYLPTFDQFNQNVHWLHYAKKMALPYVFIEHSAQQISKEQLRQILTGSQKLSFK